MSKNNKRNVKDSSIQVVQQQPKRIQALDSFMNTLARMGTGTSNLMNATEYPITRISRDYNLLNSLYRNSWIAKKVINAIPDDMCKNWYELSAQLAPEVKDRFKKLEQRTKLKDKIVEGLYWGRLYGGAAGIILVDGQEHMLDFPLIPESIMPNAFKGLLILDRWSGIYPSLELIGDINDPDFGLPMYYEIKNVVSGEIIEKVHHTRVIRFLGRKLPYFEDVAELHWAASEMEHVFDELVKRDNTSWNIASLIFQANVLVDKVDGLDQLLTLGDEQAQRDFYNVKKAQNESRNNNAMLFVGKEEEISALNYTFAGLSDIYNDFMLDISGASEIPVTRLFGRSPAGMNSTGESDEQNYYDMIAAKQTRELKPVLDKLLPIIFMSEFGYIPSDLDYNFNPVRTPSDEEMADLVQKKVASIKDVYDSGIINQRIALQELHEMSYTTNMFASITDEDIEAASDDFSDEGSIEALQQTIGGLTMQNTNNDKQTNINEDGSTNNVDESKSKSNNNFNK